MELEVATGALLRMTSRPKQRLSQQRTNPLRKKSKEKPKKKLNRNQNQKKRP